MAYHTYFKSPRLAPFFFKCMYVYKSMYAKSVVNLRQTIDTHEHVFERKKHAKTLQNQSMYTKSGNNLL